jgi:hypothetical protein
MFSKYPNAVMKNTTVRALADLKNGSEKGRKIMAKERIRNQESMFVG